MGKRRDNDRERERWGGEEGREMREQRDKREKKGKEGEGERKMRVKRGGVTMRQ